MKSFLLTIALYGALSCALPLIHEADQVGEADLNFAKTYIENYYPDSTSTPVARSKRSDEIPVDKLQQMQKHFGLRVTGRLDSHTLAAMKNPRCGVPDVAEYSTFPESPKWGRKNLTYSVLNYTPDMDRTDVDVAIERAWKVWSDVTPLTFTRVYGKPADIKISFAARSHGDNIPFDGPGGQLAHAFSPAFGGSVHFDENEPWARDLKGTNLFLVAAHEFGHVLGLGHSSNPEALMFPTYRNRDLKNFGLHMDDIEGIQQLYGPSEGGDDNEASGSSINLTSTAEAPSTKWCDPHLAFDAVTSLRGEILFFKDSFFWRKYPQRRDVEKFPISAFWPALSKGIDAAYEVKADDTVFLFKGSKYWATKGNTIQIGFPKNIHSLGLPKSVKSIDAAAHDSSSKKTYFFSGNSYWKYDEAKKSMEKGYPRKIAVKVNAAFLHHGHFYLFRGSNQYEFDSKTKKFLSIKKSDSWFGCQ
uniref:stromelysin-1-like n=1 Tax=Podarcis muralis TaxID=64176 RepID=UPI00109EEC4E|nr:stromelysin-1-like [Podarcis muralis]